MRRLPLADFRTDHLQIMIGHGIGIAPLILMALHLLAGDPLADGDFHPGDLLVAILGIGDN